LWLLLLFVGPGVLAMLGENDGPSMLSYAASGATYGAGFFLPFIVVTFAAAVFVQNMGVRVGVTTHRGFSELIFQRYGRFWGWVSSIDLIFTNVVTLIAELVAIRVGLAFFGVPGWVAVAGTVGLVALSSFAGSYRRWQSVALSLAAFNLLFLIAAFFSRPAPGALAGAFLTWQPVPGGPVSDFLLIAASNIGATVTPWMLFFQQSATTDKGLTSQDLRGGKTDTFIGGALAAITGCAALVIAVPLFTHGIQVTADGGAGYASALQPLIGTVGSALFAFGLIEAGALAVLTISASSAYALGEVVPGGAHSFNDTARSSRVFHSANLGITLIAGLITLIPGAPLLSIALNANLLATIFMPAALVFLLLLANDRKLMGAARNGPLANAFGIGITVIITVSGAAYAVVAFAQDLR
jgi:Mn2+/Fe2+ NRAMP family transporter